MTLWLGFISFIIIILVLDLFVIHRDSRLISVYEALAWTGFWIALAMAFNLIVFYLYEYNISGVGIDYSLTGKDAALQFFTGYLLEKSLSIDNIFVIALIFSYFEIPLQYQHRVLFWGIFGAIILRGLMIVSGLTLIHHFEWVNYIFGAILLFSAIKLLIRQNEKIEPDNNLLVKLIKRILPVSDKVDNENFFTTINGRRSATPLLLCLIMIETADIVFAIDSIPAIIAITRDPFLVFTSNIFAILGLRSLYFALASIMHKLRFMKISLVFLLAFIGVKMLLTQFYPISVEISLIVIASILSVGIIASIFSRETEEIFIPLADEIQKLMMISYRGARRVVILVTGSTIMLAGIIMIVTPGPAFIVIPMGLAILSVEFIWARRLLKKFRREAKKTLKRFRGKDG